MQSLSKVAMHTGQTGTTLPVVFRSLENARVAFRRSGTSMIAGAPGSYKSVLALNLLAHWATDGCTGLYFSADADAFTVSKRMAAMLTGASTDAVESSSSRTGGLSEHYAGALTQLDGVGFVFGAVSRDTIDHEMGAFESVYGDYPDVVFIDNLMNCVDGPDEWLALRQMTKDLDVIAREAGSHFCVLHHTSESKDSSPEHPPPRWAIQGKVSQIPRLILTVAASGSSLGVACVKNTNGPQDPAGRDVIRFRVTDSLRVAETSAQPILG